MLTFEHAYIFISDFLINLFTKIFFRDNLYIYCTSEELMILYMSFFYLF